MAKTPYDDLIFYPYRGISSHHPMPLSDRAAQFSPFAALTGYDRVIQETARYTEEKVELADDERILLDEKLRFLFHVCAQHPIVTVTFFRPDEHKQGGQIFTITSHVKKVNPYMQQLDLINDISISFSNLLALDSPCFSDMIDKSLSD